MPRLLIADDNEAITEILTAFAENEGYETVVAADGEETLQKFFAQDFDALLLDVMMPKKDGFAVCREIRASSNVPILMVTARGDDYDRIMGLDIGADDYIVKPFSPAEVMARLRAVMRRLERSGQNASGHGLTWGKLHLEEDSCRALLSGHIIPLTRKEFDLLWLLMENRGRAFSREQLLDSLWGYDYTGDTNVVDVYIRYLRSKIDDVFQQKYIHTVRGVGYVIRE